MQLLDTMLAFILTLAALATVVTVVFEIIQRILLMRQSNLLEVLKLLNKELGSMKLSVRDEELSFSPDMRWHFIKTVLTNPYHVSKDEQSNLLSKFPEKNYTEKEIEDKFKHLSKYKNRRTLYQKISLEHVLRRLADFKEVQNFAAMKGGATRRIKIEFNRLALRYEQFTSSVAAKFRQDAQFWSIIIGVLFAFSMNVDGLRIFETYHADADLAKAIIAQQEGFDSTYAEAKERAEKIDKAEKTVKEAKEKLDETKKKIQNEAENNDSSKIIDKLESEYKQAITAREQITSLEEIRKSADRALQQLTNLVVLGVPIGWNENDPKRFKDSLGKFDPVGIIAWFFSVLVTGILIGLGAPFWL